MSMYLFVYVCKVAALSMYIVIYIYIILSCIKRVGFDAQLDNIYPIHSINIMYHIYINIKYKSV